MSRTTRAGRAKGYVYLIGAGPGDPELLTLKAERALSGADVILYDDLVSSQLVGRFAALKIYTGKRKGSHHFEQDAINEEILRHAREGKKVARLKGGDPFVFGRGGEELEILRKNGIGYEIIPGITAAHGASAYAEIPLTMRHLSSSVAFCTGHPVSKIQVPDADTLVYYMVASSLHEVLDAAKKQGRSDSLKGAIVLNATRYNQKVISGTLKELRQREEPLSSPALLILGGTLNHTLAENWYSRKRRVLLAGGDSGCYKSEECLKVYLPHKPVEGARWEKVKKYLLDIESFTVLLFFDALSVVYFFMALGRCRKDLRHLAGCKIYSAGEAASEELRNQGVIADCSFDNDGSGELLARLQQKGVMHESILLPASTLLNDYPVEELKALQNQVTALGLYSYSATENSESIDLDCIDEIYFSSPSSVRNFRKLYLAIPEKITVTTATDGCEAEYQKLFGG